MSAEAGHGFRTSSLVVVLGTIAACSANASEPTFGAGQPAGSGGAGDDGDSGMITDGGVLPDAAEPGDGCSEASKLVYVVTSDNRLYSFNPLMNNPNAFTLVGDLGCPTGGTPNSMAVGRDGFAYVLFGEDDPLWGTYNCRAINKINIEDAHCEGATPFACGSGNFTKFGMGFATNSATTTEETLYLGNSLEPGLASLDVVSGTLNFIGTLPNKGPEFTGNAQGELWGFFPYYNPPRAIQVERSSGSALQTINLGSLPSIATATRAAWAWAFWGGSFYVFYLVDPPDSTSNVYKVELDGTTNLYIANTGLEIVGAGVSTCAPLVVK